MSAVEPLDPRLEVEVVASLDERRDHILAIVEGAALDIGAELLAAKREHPGQFMDWVARELPFGIDKAERIMAVTKAFAGAPPEVQEALPPAWTTMFELSRLPTGFIQEAIGSGKVTPTMSRADARKLVTGSAEPREPASPVHRKPSTSTGESGFRVGTDAVAHELMRRDPTELPSATARLLQQWLDQRGDRS